MGILALKLATLLVKVEFLKVKSNTLSPPVGVEAVF